MQKRFESNQIYTYIGDILVAVNPFINLGLYSKQHQKRYIGRSRFENPPHIFAVADAAHQVNFIFNAIANNIIRLEPIHCHDMKCTHWIAHAGNELILTR